MRLCCILTDDLHMGLLAEHESDIVVDATSIRALMLLDHRKQRQ